MAYNLLPWDHDQQFLVPPDIREWLGEDHEVCALLEAGGLLDFSAFYARRREDGWGRAAYHPAMMALLLLYAYARGERSSRRIERRCREDVAFRVLCANQTPDHATIARFRVDHEEALKGLHVGVLALCARAGMVSLGLVALDSTKMAADASKGASKRYDKIVAELEAMYAEAAAVDAAEDEQGDGGDGGDGRLPRRLAERRRRRERFVEAAGQIQDEVARERAAFEQVEARQRARERAGNKRQGRPRKHPPKRPEPEGRRGNVTDPDSRMLRKPGGFVQGYSGQLLVSEDGVALAMGVTNEQNDLHWLHPMLDAAQANLAAAGIDAPIGVLLADNGYYTDDNVTAAHDHDPELLIATLASSKLAVGAIEADQVAQRSPVAQRMTERLTSDQGKAIYARRGCTVEPQFGDNKHNKGFDRFSRRGRDACDAEWSLHHIAKNLRRWARRGTTADGTGTARGTSRSGKRREQRADPQPSRRCAHLPRPRRATTVTRSPRHHGCPHVHASYRRL